ncbi:delta-1-pyrroline-5-carboxylate dehydrogenase, mitochondrial-like [Rhagoletis pomonella]|uniref:delta-1-pyrroline-5-carboxylate dehydrogenase, mitochondrial-like n=1 Tax=Rhagoletis pomonella TaxID=28610 RepID=UPI00177FAB6F|nr:delta-1-pyrroline-5-carboxylate dehydrogenase, mitochondrial-like [Rhagoletis pomonella]XP_036323070.1 delta-1-pyrroline-5-carboxylate dehydrogenase, mitochondrial-like [Rhagoletis pomonella]
MWPRLLFTARRSAVQINIENALKISSRASSSQARQAEISEAKLTNSVLSSEKFTDIRIYNEPIPQYLSGSDDIKKLENALERYQNNCEDIPIVINGKEIRKGKEVYQVIPHRKSHKLAKYYYADDATIKEAIQASVKKQKEWDRTPLTKRIEIWERAADLMSKKYRADLLATTMLGQSKTVIQAEIDSGAELIDFTRMNAGYLKQLANDQPLSPTPDVTKNHLRVRGLEGFVAAITPFNFTAIGGNLAYTPALMGCSVLWKPSDTAMLSSWTVFKIMREAGVPDGVVNFVPAIGKNFGDAITSSPDLAGINFTGSTATFKTLWKLVANKIDDYKNYPRLVGECGGKNFHFIHPSAHVETAVAQTIRSAFEYGGQKCSACSRLYVPESLWESQFKGPLIEKVKKLKVGDACEVDTFYSAVIDDNSFQRISGFINEVKEDPECTVLAGGNLSNVEGFFVEPTIVEVKDPHKRVIRDEIFGPVLSVYVYKDGDLKKTIDLVRNTTKYALTGSVFATDESFLKQALDEFKDAAGNFYINDKSTGAVVGQQPFGGARQSGTNDKAGCPFYLLRWASLQAVKETFVPIPDIYYPYMNKTKN